MRGYLAKRLAQNVLTFFLFLTVVFILLDAQPGDFGNVYLNDPRLTADQRAILRGRLGLDDPIGERYVKWLGNFLQGDFGISFSNYPRPVMDVIAERAPRTLVLFLSATVFSFYLGFLAGKLLAWRRGGLFEYVATIGGVGLYTVFTPWFGLMMILIFAYSLKLFPIGKFIDPVVWRGAPASLSSNDVFTGMLLTAFISSVFLFVWLLVSRRIDSLKRRRFRWAGVLLIFVSIFVFWAFLSGGQNVPECGLSPDIGSQLGCVAGSGAGRYALDILRHLILPIFTLALISFAGTMLLTRNSMLETLREDYIQAARAKGLPEKIIRDRHAARNAMLPVVTSFVFSLAFALDGGVITESIFSWPGMGQTLLVAAQVEDIPMAIGGLVFTGTMALTAHLVADMLYAYLDPRIRYA
jgi:peptide/nickel transport system permease protein